MAPKHRKGLTKTASLSERYGYFRICFTVVLCLIPYFFMWSTLLCVLIIGLITLIGYIWRHMSANRIDPRGRGVFITGCDSGFGFIFAQHFDELGFTVFAGCLNEKGDGARKLRKEGSKRLHVVGLDVTKDHSVSEALLYVKKNLPKNGLWGVINNAGINMYGEVELVPVSVYERGFSVNLYGPIRVIHTFLSLVRSTQGRIVNITSVHGRFSIPCQSNYETAKHGIETLSDSLRLEMKKFGVDVCIVEPGMYGTMTSIGNEENVKKRTQEVKEMWDQASEDVKMSYSLKYLLSWLHKPTGKWPPQDSDLSPVVTAVDDAICSDTPLTRYLVDGRESFIDPYAVLARIHKILPTWMTDRGIASWRKCYKSPK